MERFLNERWVNNERIAREAEEKSPVVRDVEFEILFPDFVLLEDTLTQVFDLSECLASLYEFVDLVDRPYYLSANIH